MSERALELTRRGGDPAAQLAQLQALYRDVDAAFAQARCEASSECCRFGVTGREPQVTAVEVALIEQAIAKRGGPLAKRRRALPLAAHRDERICPLLEQPGRCSVYDARPLGCRTFFCERADVAHRPARAELREFVRRLQGIAVAYARDGDRPQALARALSRRGT